MDSQKRLMLALGLSLLVTMGYMAVVSKSSPHSDAAPGPSPTAAGQKQSPLVIPSNQAAQIPEASSGSIAMPVQTIERNRGSVHYLFSNRGAGLERAQLQGNKMREQQQMDIGQGIQRFLGHPVPDAPQMDLALPVPGQPLPLSVEVRGTVNLASSVVYNVAGDSNDQPLVFKTEQQGLAVTKTFHFSESGLETDYSLLFENRGKTPIEGEYGIYYGRGIDPSTERAPSFFGGVGNQSHSTCSVGDSIKKEAPKDKAAPEERGLVHFFGVDQQYFLAALYPLDGAQAGRCIQVATPTERSATAYFPLHLKPGESVTQRFGLYVGPKDGDLLSKIGKTFQPHLEKTVDFGIWAAICKLLLTVLNFFQQVTHSWGIAIILLTVGVKVVLLPLTHKSMVSAESMKKLQPRMEELKKKFPDDKQKQQSEMMKLYQEAKVNPLGGCLPMLIQMPVWIALFTTLRNTYQIYREPFFLWNDLTFKDPTYLLPLALGLTMIVTQKLQPQMMDAAQAKMMTYIMPVFFTGIMLQYPAGLTLYIFTNNLLSIAQQYGLKRYLKAREPAAEATVSLGIKKVSERKS